jgi:hypothetical protein
MFERKVVFLSGRVEPMMLTVRFTALPVLEFTPSEDQRTAIERVDSEARVLPDLVKTYNTWPQLRTAFEQFVEEVEATGRPAIVSAAAVEGLRERRFFGFNRWAKGAWRVNYDRLDRAV